MENGNYYTCQTNIFTHHCKILKRYTERGCSKRSKIKQWEICSQIYSHGKDRSLLYEQRSRCEVIDLIGMEMTLRDLQKFFVAYLGFSFGIGLFLVWKLNRYYQRVYRLRRENNLLKDSIRKLKVGISCDATHTKEINNAVMDSRNESEVKQVRSFSFSSRFLLKRLFLAETFDSS